MRTRHNLILRHRQWPPFTETYPLVKRIVPRRFLALIAAVLTTAGLVTTAAARPASAAEPNTICLTNANSYCLGIAPGDIIVIIHGAVGAGYELYRIIRDHIGNDPEGDEEDELEDENDTSLCLTDTGLRPGVDAWLGPCGANGTVWIWVRHTDGYYLYSRYSVDNHVPALVLTVNPLSNHSAVHVDIGANPGGADWQTFSYY